MTGNKGFQCLPQSEIRQSPKELTRNEAEGDYKGRPLISYITKFINIIDSNIIGNKKFAKEIFKKMIPLGISWIGDAPISVADDAELLDLIADSGCKALGIGFETINQGNLDFIKKTNQVSKYKENIDRIHNKGIAIKGYFIFGFDNDVLDVFEKTINFAKNTQIDLASFYILTPYPGTEIFRQFKKQGRLMHSESDYPAAWALYDRKHCVYQPKGMTPEQLEYGVKWSYGQFYSAKSIRQRLSKKSEFDLYQKAVCIIYNCLLYLRNASKRKSHPYLPSKI